MLIKLIWGGGFRVFVVSQMDLIDNTATREFRVGIHNEKHFYTLAEYIHFGQQYGDIFHPIKYILHIYIMIYVNHN